MDWRCGFRWGRFGLSLDGEVIAAGLLAALALGLFGALPPAWRCLRMPLAEGLEGLRAMVSGSWLLNWMVFARSRCVKYEVRVTKYDS